MTVRRRNARIPDAHVLTASALHKSLLILALSSLAVTCTLLMVLDKTTVVQPLLHLSQTKPSLGAEKSGNNFMTERINLPRKQHIMDQHDHVEKDSVKKATRKRYMIGKERLVELLDSMNFTHLVDEKTWKRIPPWSKITNLYGDRPVVIGVERCQDFQNKVPEVDRLVGAAGLFNTGTNLLAELLKRNCHIPARIKKLGRKRGNGMEWQVPWGKHTPLELKNHTIQDGHYKTVNKHNVLPVVAIREPYEWFHSMCHNNYVARWPHRGRCPNLIYPNQTLVTVMMQYFHGSIKQYHTTLAHLWNDWNRQYLFENMTDPRLMVRHKDLIFFPREVTEIVCDCAGGVTAPASEFSYVMEAAKPNRKGAKPFDGLVGNWIKYGKEFRVEQFPKEDLRIAKQVLDQDIMRLFGFKIPP